MDRIVFNSADLGGSGGIMALCDEAHGSFDGIANRDVHAGELPGYMHVRGKVVWYAYQGPLVGLGDAWQTFMGKAQAARLGPIHGPPGEVFVCDPADHTEDRQAKLITIMWAPLEL